MEFDRIPGRRLSFDFVLVDGQSCPAVQDVLEADKLAAVDGEYTLRTAQAMFKVRLSVASDAKRLEDEVLVGIPYLSRIVSVRNGRVLTVVFFMFDGRTETMADVEIGVDEYIVSKARGRMGYPREVAGICDALTDDFVYERDDHTTWFFMVAGPAAEAEFSQKGVESDVQDDAESARPPESFPTQNTAFQVICDQSSFIAAETSLDDGRVIYLMSRYHNRKNRKVIDRSIRLARGFLRFADWTRTGEVAKIAKSQVQKMAGDRNGYLRKWDEFGDLEGEILLKKARAAGFLRYDSFTAGRDGTLRVHLVDAPGEEWSGASAIEYIGEKSPLPEYLTNPGMTFTQYVSNILPPGDMREEKPVRQTNPVYEVEAVAPHTREVFLKNTESLPGKQGRLVISLLGDLAQIKRRIAARRRIDECRSANPSLKLIVEASGEPPILRSPRKVPALTPFVRRKVFSKNPPTAKQEEAIRVALNTPDIALIQGPPGTGKTTVITAILERLNEDTDKRRINAGRVLLTGFQHDAVENMISRMSVNSLPVPKFGGRTKSDEEDQYRLRLEEWCHSLAEKVRDRYPELRKTEEEARLDNLCLQYSMYPSEQVALTIVSLVADERSPLPEELRREAKRMLESINRKHGDEYKLEETLRCIRNLRISSGGFADDGPSRALDLECALNDLGGPPLKDLEALHAAASMERGAVAPEDLLVRLKALKRVLMSVFAPAPHFQREKKNIAVERLAANVRKAIRNHRQKAAGGLNFAFARFLSVLEQNPDAVFDSLSDYSFAYAATCQQSQGKQMAQMKVKGVDDDEQTTDIEYDYVIVDEAARVSPRDLMIALAQGRRIVLVGDHRQLPHIIDESVAQQMEKDGSATVEDELEWLKKSMFGYLFAERLPVLEARDGITRRVTLDRQYRMHPMLGDFISQNFYERFNADERVGSGLPAEFFSHNLPKTGGVPVVWLDVPISLGASERSNSGSLFRDCEAKQIRKLYSEWLGAEEGRDLSYGIISFYKAQASKIRKELGGGENSSSLRIGTVDSFQGMEFDVVFLSLVRTHSTKYRSGDEVDDKSVARMYGFLSLYNRLNVSMSRQKKLLVLVGDSELTRSPMAEKYIPGLVNFRKLCEQHGRVINAS